MGSRKTHAKRMERLTAVGVTSGDAERLMSPIGLDLGARTPEETAVSICAEIIARRTGRHVPSLARQLRRHSLTDRTGQRPRSLAACAGGQSMGLPKVTRLARVLEIVSISTVRPVLTECTTASPTPRYIMT